MDIATRTNPVKLSALLFFGLAIASSWLVFPYFIQGQQLLRGVGDESRMIKAGGVSRYLTRELIRTSDLEITATLATDEYFQYVDRAAIVGNLRPDRNLIFFVAETIHRGELPADVPAAETPPPPPPSTTRFIFKQNHDFAIKLILEFRGLLFCSKV